MAKASRNSSNFGENVSDIGACMSADSDTEEESPHIAKEKKIHIKSSTVCRYYATGTCRRGSECRFVHLQRESVSQEYAYPNEHLMYKRICHYYAAGHCRYGSACHFVHSPPENVPQGIPQSECAYLNGHEMHTRTPHKGTANAIYTVAPHVVPQGLDARDAFDSSSDIFSSDSTPSDQSLNAAFQVMSIEESVSSEYLHSPFSQLSPSLQYSNNTDTGYSNLGYPGYNGGYTPTGLKPRAATRLKAEQGKEIPTLYRTKPCKFFSTRKTCPGGTKCRFIHDVEKYKRPKKADNRACDATPSHLPPKPRSLQEELKARNYYPITWRVIGGGVMMGLPCKAFAAGYCPDGKNCRLFHETEVCIFENGAVQVTTQTSETSVAAPPSIKPCLDLDTGSKRGTVCTDCSGSFHTIHSTDGGTSGSTDGAEKSISAANSNNVTVVPSQHRRTRSMSMPTSPSVLRAPHIFAEL